MTLAVRLLGRPRIEDGTRDVYRLRSQKSWALLGLLVLGERPLSRSELADLLFPSADDPLGALRWSLAELRRALGPQTMLVGDPVTLRLPQGALVDVQVLVHGGWDEALALEDLGEELLDGIAPQGSVGADIWLGAERRRIAAATVAALHEAALALMAEGESERALACASRAVRRDPLDENLQALLIRLLRQSGDLVGARQAYEACRAVLREELGIEPGAAVESAWRIQPSDTRSGPHAAVALLEAGQAAVAAGALVPGMTSLRTAVELADQTRSPDLRVRARLILAETLIHSARGLDEEGIAALHEADVISRHAGERTSSARIRAELGYVDFLRARYDRAARWLIEALDMAGGELDTRAVSLMYLGSVESDRGDYRAAMGHLEEAIAVAGEARRPRRAAYALAMLGRIHLLRGHLAPAESAVRQSLEICEAEHWLSFQPWPETIRGELLLAQGEVTAAEAALGMAFARACQVGDPCWEGFSARGMALVADARGDAVGALELLDDAERRCSRVSDAYAWLDGHILDARCTLGLRHGHPSTGDWIATLGELAERTDMRELRIRALIHGAAFGRAGDADAARSLLASVDNPALTALLGGPGPV
ncbi:MAG: tetratricopeptide repeat protein [Actinomycetales bacterium]|nr:tetratricopeptide repeat protein [Actinomycetales bacterium]